MRGRKLIVDWKHTAEELHARYKQERNTHIAKRLQALFLLRRGTPTRQVALIVGVSRMSIHKWLTWYRTGGAAPGAIIACAPDDLRVACGEGALRLLEVQPESRPRMDSRAFINGYRPQVGERLG